MIVALEEAKYKLIGLRADVKELGNALRIEETRESLKDLEAQTQAPDFWSNAEKSSKVLQVVKQGQDKVAGYERLCARLEDAIALAEMAIEENDESFVEEVQGELAAILEEEERRRIEVLLSGGLLDESIHVGTWNGIRDVCHNDRYAMIQIPNPAEDKFEFFFLMLRPLQPGEEVVLFDHISFPDIWNSEAMRNIADLKIEIQAFGVQAYQLDSCLLAMTEAFPDHFPFEEYVDKQ